MARDKKGGNKPAELQETKTVIGDAPAEMTATTLATAEPAQAESAAEPTPAASAEQPAAGAEGTQADTTDAPPPPVNTSPKRSLGEWAKLDNVEFEKFDGFNIPEAQIGAALFTREEYDAGKNGSVFKKIAPPAKQKKAVPPIHLPSPELWARMEMAQEDRIRKAADHETAKREAREAKAALELCDELIAKLYDEHRKGPEEPGLYDAVDEPPATETKTVTTKQGELMPESAWRKVTIEELHLDQATDTIALNDAGIHNVGQLCDYTEDHELEEIPRIDPDAAERISDAIGKLWNRLGIKPPMTDSIPEKLPEPEGPISEIEKETRQAISAFVQQLVNRLEFIGIAADVAKSDAGRDVAALIVQQVVDDDRKGVPVKDIFNDAKLTMDEVNAWAKAADALPDADYANAAVVFNLEVKAAK